MDWLNVQPTLVPLRVKLHCDDMKAIVVEEQQRRTIWIWVTLPTRGICVTTVHSFFLQRCQRKWSEKTLEGNLCFLPLGCLWRSDPSLSTSCWNMMSSHLFFIALSSQSHKQMHFFSLMSWQKWRSLWFRLISAKPCCQILVSSCGEENICN